VRLEFLVSFCDFCGNFLEFSGVFLVLFVGFGFGVRAVVGSLELLVFLLPLVSKQCCERAKTLCFTLYLEETQEYKV